VDERRIVVPCPKCTQKLRFPERPNTIHVKCGVCGHEFDHLGMNTASKESPQDRERLRKKGVFLKWCSIMALLLGVAGSVLVGFTLTDVINNKDWGGYLFALPAAAGGGIWYALYARSKRCFALSAQDVLAHDTRPPVIYLRSFKDDGRYVKTMKDKLPLWRLLHPIKLWGSVLNAFDTRTEEEVLAEVLCKIGPVVGIGRPGEKLPQLGAARVYVDDDHWQQTVHDFLSQAGLVVLRLGKTPGFFWEVEQSTSKMNPARLIVLVPLSHRKYAQFCERAATHFPKGLPAYNCSRFRRIFGANLLGNLKAMIYFEPDWTPVFVDLARIHWPWKYKLRMAGRRDLFNAYDWALQPVYKQLAVEWTPPIYSPTRIATVVFKSVPLLFLIGIAVLIAVVSNH
jgi:hypothetical protein